MTDFSDWVAELDQMKSALRDMAGMSRAFYLALLEEGFARDEAMQLTATWLSDVLRGGGSE